MGFSDAAELGYAWLHNADLLEGATYPFMTTLVLPPGDDADFAILRFPSTNEEHYLKLDATAAVPSMPDMPK